MLSHPGSRPARAGSPGPRPLPLWTRVLPWTIFLLVEAGEMGIARIGILDMALSRILAGAITENKSCRAGSDQFQEQGDQAQPAHEQAELPEGHPLSGPRQYANG